MKFDIRENLWNIFAFTDFQISFDKDISAV